MLSTVQSPKTKHQLINQLQRKNPLKFEVLEYSDTDSKNKISKALDDASRKGIFSIIIIQN